MAMKKMIWSPKQFVFEMTNNYPEVWVGVAKKIRERDLICGTDPRRWSNLDEPILQTQLDL